MEECRAVDHDLLFGRKTVCHVQLLDKRLSRMTAMLAAHAGGWYLHTLARCPVARNGQPVDGLAPVEDGDELTIGPLGVRIELRVPEATDGPTPSDPAPTDVPEPSTETVAPDGQPAPPGLHAAGMQLDKWLRTRAPTAAGQSGISGWLEAQRQRLRRFWYDTPEATTARSLRAAGRTSEAFDVLDRAIRVRPDSPTLLRELYRLYEAAGLTDLSYRPLRQIEKLAAARGESDTWVLQALARVCERLGELNPAMFDRAAVYWTKLETATGVSYARERSAVHASRALRDGGFAATTDSGA
jgi:hypothetical protein